MSKNQLYQPTCVRKFLRPDATPLTPEDIEEIRNAPGNISNAGHIMCKKFHIVKKLNESRPASQGSSTQQSSPSLYGTEKISGDALYKKEAKRDEKNKANVVRLLSTT
nr:11380_t:CDS:2 [Entrophospora candida]CAG8605353.1 13630_t:CDS:2 [Entrophospora candida]